MFVNMQIIKQFWKCFFWNCFSFVLIVTTTLAVYVSCLCLHFVKRGLKIKTNKDKVEAIFEYLEK